MGAHWEVLQFMVVPSMTEAVILGLVWLDKWGPMIWWERGYQKLQIGVGPQQPAHEYARKGAERHREVAVGQGHARGKAPFSAVYADLAKVFSERDCDVLSHRPTDCAIDILPGAKLPKPQMYAMTSKEMEELCQYIDKNLARRFIQLAQSRIAGPVLFADPCAHVWTSAVSMGFVLRTCIANEGPIGPFGKG